ncbi:MAG: sigma-E processing peptidase SpoIIGA [Oscillospiraceae bacterium]|nr:sigma-E processing peptidase SpoIIGA [Oscillospiraceae bacterium]MDE5884503.1 sigma-E processing peptidase SpoIIGA [Oscillospiraceae bacterium]
MQVVYLDVLLFFNLYMNYLLISLTARIAHRKTGFFRAFLGAVLGSLSSLVFFLPEQPVILSGIYKILTAVLICLIAFGKKRIIWSCVCFLGMSFLTAGILFAISLTDSLRTMQNNACYYLDISLFQLIFLTILAYGILSVVQYFHDRTHKTTDVFRIQIRYRTHTAELEGFPDTGNSLVDFYTGKYVIICDRDLLYQNHIKPVHSHPIPYMTISGSGMLEVFQPDEVLIREECGISRSVDALIGMSPQADRKAIFHPKLLNY